MRVISIDYNNTGNIHFFIGHDVVNIKNNEYFDLKKYDVLWFCDNYYYSLNKVIEKYFMQLGNRIVFNTTNLYYWGMDRVKSYKIMEKAFRNNKNVEILRYKLYKAGEKIDWKGKGVVKPAFEDAGYKKTIIFEDIKEIEERIKNEDVVIQEYFDGEEVAVGSLFVNSEVVLPVYLNFEFKRSISKDVGGNTGQSAEFGFFTNNPYFTQILLDISEYLKRNKIKYTGVIDINGGYKDGKFYPFEITASRDGYPQVMAFLYKQDLEEIIKNKRFNDENKYKYSLVIRRDIIDEEEKKEVSFEVENGSWLFIPEVPKVNDIYYTNSYHIGVMYAESKGPKIPALDFKFKGVDVIYYTTFEEEVKDKIQRFGDLV